VVSASKEYRDYAGECLDWARTARSERERQIFLQMAQTWLAAAVRADLRNRPATTSRADAAKSDSESAA
jgi:hypothetical protein